MFNANSKTIDYIDKIRSFMEANIYPLEREFLASSSAEDWSLKLAPLRDQVKSQDLWGLCLPKTLGGKGLDLFQFAFIAEELGRSPLAHYVFGCQAPDIGNIELLEAWGNQEQKDTYLSPLAAGKIRSCFGMTEKETAGSNPTLLKASATPVEGGYQLNGEKWFTSSADGANFCIVMAVSDPNAKPHNRASMFIVPNESPGFDLVRNIPVMGHPGRGYFSHGEVRLNNCFVPESNLLGERGMGFLLAQDRLGPGRIHHCMRWIGICQRVFHMMCQRVSSRQISRDKTLADSDVIKTWLAELKCEIHAARLMVLDAAYKICQEGCAHAKDEISLIKFYVANTLAKVLDKGIQSHGALGVTDDTVISFFYREERAARIYDGPDEVHKLSVAKRILHAYK